ncbi:TPA: hypothetical protein R4Y85_005175 [Raoultella planticola]|nr:hypothetical protein [Raoultella planticola]VTM98324.1 TraG-like protein, N-terminal region [Raoultella planticola]HED2547368.1 hypothetical protein [Raoultella planticola]HED2591374.1 hypothetical protein [Raoultella planticola]
MSRAQLSIRVHRPSDWQDRRRRPRSDDIAVLSRINTAVADLRQLRFDVQHTRISDPVLAQKLRDLTMECYPPSLVRLKQRGDALNYIESQDVAWVGAS